MLLHLRHFVQWAEPSMEAHSYSPSCSGDEAGGRLEPRRYILTDRHKPVNTQLCYLWPLGACLSAARFTHWPSPSTKTISNTQPDGWPARVVMRLAVKKKQSKTLRCFRTMDSEVEFQALSWEWEDQCSKTQRLLNLTEFLVLAMLHRNSQVWLWNWETFPVKSFPFLVWCVFKIANYFSLPHSRCSLNVHWMDVNPALPYHGLENFEPREVTGDRVKNNVRIVCFLFCTPQSSFHISNWYFVSWEIWSLLILVILMLERWLSS